MLAPIYKHAARQLSTIGRATSITSIGRRQLHTPVPFDWKDPLGSYNLFSEDELAIAETAESYCQERMLPRVLGKYEISLLSIC
jgi:glutaryl-CoA dehydrogenase